MYLQLPSNPQTATKQFNILMFSETAKFTTYSFVMGQRQEPSKFSFEFISRDCHDLNHKIPTLRGKTVLPSTYNYWRVQGTSPTLCNGLIIELSPLWRILIFFLHFYNVGYHKGSHPK